MPPVNTSASSPEVDNEATAELPVLDVAAYESSLGEHTDSFRVPDAALTPVTDNAVEATTAMPALPEEAIPTLQAAAVPAYDIDHSGTHEMPPMPQLKDKAHHHRSRTKSAPPAAVAPAAMIVTAPAPAPVPARATAHINVPVMLPPSPPLIEDLRHALASAERRIEELTERARIADAERSVAVARVNAENAQLREQLAVHLESLHTARERLSVQGADFPELEDQLFARNDRIVALEKELAGLAAALGDKNALLARSEQRCESLDCDAMNLRATVARRNSQIATIEADLVARQEREARLSVRLAEALASTDPYVPRLRGELAALEEQILGLKADLELARAHAAEKDQDLQVAEESIRNLEIEVRDKTGKLEEANVTVEEWRAVIAESQRSILQRDSKIQQLEKDLEKRVAKADDSAAQTGEEIALEGAARVLIRTDGNTDFVHVLGRRTRIGRGPDNEVVLDTKHVSRYHAVLLAGPVHTLIEDLKSTNGVFVNGKRISRQALKDGDRVTVGRTQFRYSVRD
jgi:peptidoglycan hydrolase CwlO-like protein